MKKVILSTIFLFCLGVPVLAENITSPPATAVGTALPGQVPGTQTNDSACSTCVGAIFTASVASGSAVNLPIAGTDTTVVTLSSVPPGDYDVSGTVVFGGTSATTTLIVAGVNTVTNTQPSQPTTGRASLSQTAATAPDALNSGTTQVTLAATGSIFLIGSCVAVSGTCTGFGMIRARRAR